MSEPNALTRFRNLVLSRAVIIGSVLINLAGGTMAFSQLHNSVSIRLSNYIDREMWPGLLIIITAFVTPALTTGLAKRRYFLVGLIPYVFELSWLIAMELESPESTEAATNKVLCEMAFWSFASWIACSSPVALIKLAIRRSADKRAARLAAAAKPQTYGEGVWPPPPTVT